jgi:uncharacterized protein
MLGESPKNGKKIFERLRTSGGRNMSAGYFLTVIGLICFLEGLPYFAFPQQLKAWLQKLILMPTSQLRTLGGVLMAVGLLLVYLGRRHGG